MSAGGLDGPEQRRLDDIERQLDREDPDMVSAFRVGADPPDSSRGLSGYLAFGLFSASVGMLTDVQGMVLVGMMLGLLCPLLPPPFPPDDRSVDPREGDPPAGRISSV